MALDRFIYWQDTKPSRDEVTTALSRFMGKLGTTEEKDDRIYVLIPGEPDHPFTDRYRDEERINPRGGRWIEVVFGEDCIDVLTRDQDPLTNAIAESFATSCAKWWRARLEDGVQNKDFSK